MAVLTAGLVALAIGITALPFALYRHYWSWARWSAGGLTAAYLAASAATGVMAAFAAKGVGISDASAAIKGIGFGIAGQLAGRAAWSPWRPQSPIERSGSEASGSRKSSAGHSEVGSVLLKVESWLLGALDTVSKDKVYDWTWSVGLEPQALASYANQIYARYVAHDPELSQATRKGQGTQFHDIVKELSAAPGSDDILNRLRTLVAEWVVRYSAKKPVLIMADTSKRISSRQARERSRPS